MHYSPKGDLHNSPSANEGGAISFADNKNISQKNYKSNNIKYVETNKNRTDTWLSLNRLSLPLEITKYGSIDKIQYSSRKVNIQNSPNLEKPDTAMIKKMSVKTRTILRKETCLTALPPMKAAL